MSVSVLCIHRPLAWLNNNSLPLSVWLTDNALNGVPTCANSPLMTDLMRGEFGFQGYITGDCVSETSEDVARLTTTDVLLCCAAVVRTGGRRGCS